MKKILAITVALLSLFLVSCSGDSYKKGIITSNDFTSEYLNLQFTPNEEMILSSQQELDEMTKAASGVKYLDDQKQQIDYKNTGVTYEMISSLSSGSPNVIVMTNNLPKRESFDDFIKTTTEKISSQDNMEITKLQEPTKRKIGADEYTKYSYQIKFGDIILTQNYYLRSIGKRIISIVTTSDKNSLDNEAVILDQFKAIK